MTGFVDKASFAQANAPIITGAVLDQGVGVAVFQSRAARWIDEGWETVVARLPSSLRGDAASLASTLGLAPLGTPWSRVFGQPVTLAVDAATDEELDLVTINGLTYFELTGEETYPVTVTLTCGGGIDSVNALLKAALLTRVAQLTAYRGDDTAPPADTYWNNICAMMGKGIA